MNPKQGKNDQALVTAHEAGSTPAVVDWGAHAALVERAQHGEVQALQALKAQLAANPHWERDVPDVASQTRQLVLKVGLGNDLLMREAWERRAAALQKELEGPNPTPLERTLCECVATCWLDANNASMMAANAATRGAMAAREDFYQRRQDRALARYLAAAQALARVRRLLAPIIAQVNIAQAGSQQMNLAVGQTTPSLAPPTPVEQMMDGANRFPADSR